MYLWVGNMLPSARVAKAKVAYCVYQKGEVPSALVLNQRSEPALDISCELMNMHCHRLQTLPSERTPRDGDLTSISSSTTMACIVTFPRNCGGTMRNFGWQSSMPTRNRCGNTHMKSRGLQTSNSRSLPARSPGETTLCSRTRRSQPRDRLRRRE